MYFFEILQYIVFIDVILSWLMIIWVRIRPKFIADIIDPMYAQIKKYIPTSIGPLDFTPIIFIFLIIFARALTILLFNLL